MVSDKLIIYSAIDPLAEKIISKSEEKAYLNCKFWKASRKEADLFINFYRGPVYGEFHRIVAILTKRLLRTRNIAHSYKNLSKLIDRYRVDPSSQYLFKIPSYKKVLDAICNESYPKYGLIDDVINWAQESQLINLETNNIIWMKINEVRQPIFSNKNQSDDIKHEIIQLLLKKGGFYIYYSDAQELFFTGIDLLSELTLEVKNKNIDAYHSNGIIYFNTKSLIKWLMNNDYLPTELTNKLLDLKVEAIKENKSEYKGKFNSLSMLIKQGAHKNDILSDALNGNVDIFLKYPRDCLRWREIKTNICDPQILETRIKLPTLRYDGLGQLKKRRNDDSHFCQFGGLTVDMLLYGELPQHGLSKSIPNIDYEIEFIPTKEESTYSLQAYVKLSSQRLASIVTDDNLIVLERPRSPDEITGNKLDGQQYGLNSNKKIKHVFHHANKRAAILRAASAIAYRYPSDALSGKAILALIKSNKNFLFEQSEIPRSDRTNLDLINDYLRPLEECDFHRKDYEQSQEEKLFGSALSIIFSKEETRISDRSTATVTIGQKIFEKREIIGCTFNLNVIEQLLDNSFALIS